MLDNLTVMKSGSPDLPGEFSGGVININTTEPKDKNYHNLQLSLGYNTITTLFHAQPGCHCHKCLLNLKNICRHAVQI
jgi:hypothetical protein